MGCNVGKTDRILRVIIGLALILAAYTGNLGSWAYIGVVPLFTGLVGWCGLYTIMGKKSCSK
ncbi:DUF2892 domain-containing protein [Marinobacterium sp. LSUCC0821]|jgi:hypothetical protein|uniref:YgaP family membrane protein n=1 Tax=Marinobacterium sp. LSUCC0821 TaxID=2668067 RepID=UPI0014522566|nr:DUF2892 domain-containing protein [Marinobacterium sp. LSUCC0821]QJD70892.1 DUF2892 domain-containing protein [Marinobacterium sp. LSUCC0821]